MCPDASPRKQSIFAGALLALASLALHSIPFFLFSRHPLGYDTGFYRRYLIEPFISFPNTAVPGLGSDALLPRILLDTLRLFHFPPDLILYGTYLAFWALTPVLLFLFLKPYIKKEGAFIGGMLLVGSSVAYTGYWYFLLKNAFALDLLLLSFIAIERKWIWAWLLLDVAILSTHKTSAIIYILTLLLLFIISEGRRKEYALHLALTGGLFALLNANALHSIVVALPSAAFLDWRTYLIFSIPFLILISAGIKAFKEYTVPKTLLAFAGISFLFPLLRLPFYERIFLFSDVALLAFAAYGAVYLAHSLKKNWGTRGMFVPLGSIAVALGLFVGNIWSETLHTLPLMSGPEIAYIEEIGNLVPEEATILTSSEEAPWFEGWTRSHIAAPGMLRDTHNFETWTALWESTSTREKTIFLADFEKPLYVSTLRNIDDLLGTPPPCLEEIVANLWRSTCGIQK
jgi:hypothetical protein